MEGIAMSTQERSSSSNRRIQGADEHKNTVLAQYQRALDAQDIVTLKNLRQEYPEWSEAFSKLFACDERTDIVTDTPSGTEAPTRSLGTAAHLASSSLKFDGAPLMFGRYRLLEQIGRGGMGAVFRAEQPELNREVAIKVILQGELATDAELHRFQHEAQAAASLRHPNIVSIHDVGCTDGLHFFAMDLMPGGSLSQRLQQGPLSDSEAVTLVLQIARAVAYLHERGVIHRDIKPSNIVFDDHGNPCLTDFGLAKSFETDSGQTRTGDLLGTASYMSPEQASGDVRNLSPRTDVYSLGAVLYELITGEPPFRGEGYLDTVLRVIEREPTCPRRIRRGISRDLEQICMKCLEKKPADRYASATLLANDLERHLRGEPIDSPAADLSLRIQRFVRRYPALVVHISVLAAVAVIVALRNMLDVGANRNYMTIQGILVVWALASFALQEAQAKLHGERWTQTLWAIVDTVLITCLIYLAEVPREALLAAYPAFVAASGLWAHQSLVVTSTVTSLVGYATLAFLEPSFATPLHHALILVAIILSVGLAVGIQVRRLRLLSQYH